MRKYRCTEPFALNHFDEEGNRLASTFIEKGTEFVERNRPLMVSAIPVVYLENKQGLQIELRLETLREYFEEISRP